MNFEKIYPILNTNKLDVYQKSTLINLIMQPKISFDTLKNHIPCSIAKCTRTIAELKKMDLIKAKKGLKAEGGWDRNFYSINWDKIKEFIQ